MQLEFEDFTADIEDPKYLTEQLITYIGNKRSLLPHIENAVSIIRESFGESKLRTADVFAGSGVVGRMLKKHSSLVVANDLEPYSALISRAYLTNRQDVDWVQLALVVAKLNNIVDKGNGPKGFIADMYAPKDDSKIEPGERVFYSSSNAKKLDAYAQLIRDEDPSFHDLLLAPLLSEASIHANTGGVFKGFYKNGHGIGNFGGSGADALSRILAPIRLNVPTLSKFNSASEVYQLDAAVLPQKMPTVDVAYLDPPYNQHPYGSNYFMLNLLVNYKKPEAVSKVSGIPEDWQRSEYNKKRESFKALSKLVQELPSRFVLLSFSNDGFLDPEEIMNLFHELGKVQVFDIDYNVYKASRNLASRSSKITEHIFMLDRG